MGIRRQSREATLQALFMKDFLGDGCDFSFENFFEHFAVPEAVRQFAMELVQGVTSHQHEIDARITCSSENWSLSRMCRVDRSLLRLASFEILFREDIPHSVAINEAIEIAKRFGTDDSPNFINGVLDRLAATAEQPLAMEVYEEKREAEAQVATKSSEKQPFSAPRYKIA